ncbi:MAG: NAD(P)/FAD-dependent oxidoreductase [Pseudomonadota bacterium]
MPALDGMFVPDHVNVAIVGAGPAGLGVARVLRDLAIPDVWVLERGAIGQSFLSWPSETRLLTPSFPGNVFGITDLNAISYDSSPGWALKCEHPKGVEYARYLDQASLAFGLNVQCGLDVLRLEPEEECFALYTDHGMIRADFVIWACGQFGAPSDGGLSGAEHARHYASVKRWRDVPGDEVFVIGGYESGIDAAVNLARSGKAVTVFDLEKPWDDNDKDPSRALSPFTQQRLRIARRGDAITLVGDDEIVAIEKENDGVRLFGSSGRSWLSPEAPILATGFASGTAPVSEWFEYDEHGLPLLTPHDESTSLPGLFLVGPEVSHNGFLFCFIYKFRQRFAVVARAIAGRMGADTSPLQLYRENNMYLDDLACCDDDKCLC